MYNHPSQPAVEKLLIMPAVEKLLIKPAVCVLVDQWSTFHPAAVVIGRRDECALISVLFYSPC